MGKSILVKSVLRCFTCKYHLVFKYFHIGYLQFNLTWTHNTLERKVPKYKTLSPHSQLYLKEHVTKVAELNDDPLTFSLVLYH